ncbi:MAG: serpin family protein, partial [Myxococcales bacterium]|nr:serpin family protein [Myxococcales bacterium]
MKTLRRLAKALPILLACGLLTSPAVAAPLSGHERFALQLFERLVKDKPNENLFLSPNSVYTALAMTWAGARRQTATEMSRVLGIEGTPDAFHQAMKGSLAALQASRGVKISIANALFMHTGYKFLDAFVGLVEKNYHSTSERVSFLDPEAARKRINRWVVKKTHGLINELIPAGVLQPTTRLVLTNAIAFDGKWKTRFDKDRTAPLPFQTPGGTSVTVPMMTIKAKFPFSSQPSFKLLSLPYTGDAVSMVVLLPTRRSSLAALRAQLTAKRLAAWLGQLHTTEVDVRLPRFSTSSFRKLKSVLKALGMPLAFSDNADFSGLTGKTELKIQEVLHKAFIEVSEAGTKAGASTAVLIGR